MILIFLAISMVALSLFLSVFAKQKLLSPSIAFIVPFTVSSIYLIFNVSRWSVVLNTNTYFVIISGCLSYLFGILLASQIKLRFGNKKESVKRDEIKFQAELNSFVLWLFFIFEIIALAFSFRAIISVVRRYGYSGNYSALIYRYRNLSIYTTESISLGGVVDWLYLFNSAIGYIWGYIIADAAANKRKIKLVYFLNFSIAIVTDLLKGGRQSAVQLIIASIICYFMLYLSKLTRKNIPLRKYFKVLICGIVGMSLFQSLGYLLGRTVQADFLQYLAVYISGGIRNLNEYLKTEHTAPDVFAKMTLPYVNRFIGNKFGIARMIYSLDLPYLSANGRNSGNIYTTFYAYIYDFGYIGVIIWPLIMGFISQRIYKKARKSILNDDKRVKTSVIVYGYLFYMLAFSFFSNKFYEGFFTISFVKIFLLWTILSYLFNNLDTGGRKLKLRLKIRL